MISPDEYEAAGVLGTDDEGPDRLDLLRWLEQMGFSLDEMRLADAQGNLAALAGDHRIVPVPDIGRAEAIARSGLPPEQFDAFATAFGFTPIVGAPPGEIGFTAAEIELFATVGGLSTMFSPEEARGFIRVLGSTFGRLGEAVVSMFLADVESPHMASGEGELALAKKVYDAVGLLDGLMDRLDPILRRHVRQAIERTRNATIDDERLRYRFAIGFVDLVGFTERSNEMPTTELAAFIRDFEGRAHDVAIASGARVVKLIGDEVMFASTDPACACRAASGLMAGFDDVGELVLPRGGLAYGEVLTRGGDYYGSVVNLASRLVDHAVPQEVLATHELVEAAGGACFFEPAGRRMIKGFRDPVPVWSLANAPSGVPRLA